MIRVQMIWFRVVMMTGNSNCGKGNYDEIERQMGNGDDDEDNDVDDDQDDAGDDVVMMLVMMMVLMLVIGQAEVEVATCWMLQGLVEECGNLWTRRVSSSLYLRHHHHHQDRHHIFIIIITTMITTITSSNCNLHHRCQGEQEVSDDYILKT